MDSDTIQNKFLETYVVPPERPFINPRLFALTDDLTPGQFQMLLNHLWTSGQLRISTVKKWREKNNLPVDRED